METKSQPETIKINCVDCECPYSYEPILRNGRELFPRKRCGPCQDAFDQKSAQNDIDEAKRQERAAHDERWFKICPELYRDTDIFQLPPEYQKIIKNWRYGAKGLGFCNVAGKGKTRTCFILLRRCHDAGKIVAAISAKRFNKVALDQYENDRDVRSSARNVLHQCHRAQVLLFDDLGKGKFTDRAEEELFDLLEYRTSHLLPTLWTINSDSDELLKMLSKDRGEPILRRLTEFSDII